MNLRNVLKRSLMTSAGVLAVAAPTYAHWGSASSWAFAGQTRNCHHSHNNGTTAIRKGRVDTIRTIIPLDGGGTLEFDNAKVTNATLTNNTADITFFGWDINNPPGGFLPYITWFDDLPRGSFGWLPASQLLYNLQAACQITNEMI